MIRLIVTMVFTILLGIGSGYFLWGTRVARLTESLSDLTLEYDTIRTELASRPPRSGEAGADAGSGSIADSLTAIRGDLAAQKQLLDQQSATLVQLSLGGRAAGACDAATAQLRVDLERCIADKKDLEEGIAPAPVPPRPPTFTVPPPARGAVPNTAPPVPIDPRYN